MGKYIGDLFVIIGCLLVLVGVYQVWPVAAWLVAGAMLIVFGVLVEMGKEAK